MNIGLKEINYIIYFTVKGLHIEYATITRAKILKAKGSQN